MSVAKKNRQFEQKTGKRKTAIAQVKVFQGAKKEGINLIINGQNYKDYFQVNSFIQKAIKPIIVTEKENNFYIECKVTGGGKGSQSEAVALGISRALVNMDENLKGLLKVHNLLTRDDRKKERKKPGQKGARAKFQFAIR